jgi:flagellar hook protein FlgE
MGVVGDNIANLNTTGFKYSQAHFEDLLAQNIALGGGVGSNQMGKGVELGSIDTIFSQGSIEASDNNTSMAINGEGFFILKDATGSAREYYSRDGNFSLDKNGYLVNSSSFRVQGKLVDPTTGTATGADTDIQINQNYTAPQATSTVNMVMNLNADTAVGGVYSSSSLVYDTLGTSHTLTTSYTKDADATVDLVTCGADTGGSLGGTYWTIDTGATNYYVWYNTGASVDPAPAGRTGIQVAISAGDTAATVASDTATALNAVATNPFSALATSAGLNITLNGGAAGAPGAGTTGWAAANFSQTTNSAWDVTATLDGVAITVEDTAGSGFASQLTFNNSGNMTSAGSYILDPGAASLVPAMTMNLKNTPGGTTTQYAAASVTNYSQQDGYAPGYLQSLSVNQDGFISGAYSNGKTAALYQLDLARFTAPDKLHREGGNLWTETIDSGTPVTGAPRTNGMGSVSGNSLEQSNVDLSAEFVKMILYQRGFQANSRIITVSDSLLEEVLSLKR